VDPAAEWPAVALALDAVMVAASVRGRETALALGTPVAVAASRENDPHPVM
jgi:hypothetical protein